MIKFYLRKKTPAAITQTRLALHSLLSQTTGLNSEKLDIYKEKQASCEWTEYDDFLSSEDLSAILADLELDALNKTKEQS